MSRNGCDAAKQLSRRCACSPALRGPLRGSLSSCIVKVRARDRKSSHVFAHSSATLPPKASSVPKKSICKRRSERSKKEHGPRCEVHVRSARSKLELRSRGLDASAMCANLAGAWIPRRSRIFDLPGACRSKYILRRSRITKRRKGPNKGFPSRKPQISVSIKSQRGSELRV